MPSKLELTWYGKDKPIKVEPRILIENKELSNTAKDENTENMLIHGDNLLALKALEKKYSGKIKCIYIDPPYNTGSAFEHYDDNLEHSTWLSLMKPRLEILWNLLTDDGLIAIQIDDNEFAHLFLLMSEICGRSNLKTICVKMASVNKIGSIPKLKEFIILAKKDGIRNLDLEKIPKSGWDSEYRTYCSNISDEDLKKVKTILENDNRSDADIDYVDKVVKNIEFRNVKEVAQKLGEVADEAWCFKNANRIVQFATLTGGARDLAINKKNTYSVVPSVFSIQTNQKKLYLIRGDFNTDTKLSRCKLLFADLYLTINPGDLWTDIKTTGLDNEGNVDFKNGKKPERLVYRIIRMNTKPNDLILDSFLGSGTTAAVAHKMKRRYIGIEMGDHAYTHCKVRLDKVIDGSDQGGISKSLNWQGGGGYRFYELAPTLINKDAFDEPIINKEYSAEMLASAVALHEGFEYKPSSETFWKQSVGNENSYLFVTTRHVDLAYLSGIKESMEDNEYLIIACKSFAQEANGKFPNIKIKKIPQMLLDKCEFGRDNYNLNIIAPPTYEDEE